MWIGKKRAERLPVQLSYETWTANANSIVYILK